MNLKLDLHIHSRHSPDGRMTLDEIVTLCRAAGLDGCAVCDHDRTLPPEELDRIREKYPDFYLIPGTEVSTDRGHLLGWFVTEPVSAREFRAAAAEIHAQGALAVLAHPYEHTTDPSRPVPVLQYIDGVEVWNSRAERKNRQANAMAEALAREHGLRRFAGSDAHVPREIGNAVTVLTVDAENVPDIIAPDNTAPDRGENGKITLDALKAALLNGDTAPSGVRGRAVDAARSQFHRRRNRRAGPISYCKWALFAVKCLLQDLTAGGGRKPRR